MDKKQEFYLLVIACLLSGYIAGSIGFFNWLMLLAAAILTSYLVVRYGR